MHSFVCLFPSLGRLQQHACGSYGPLNVGGVHGLFSRAEGNPCKWKIWEANCKLYNPQEMSSAILVILKDSPEESVLKERA